MPWPDSGTTVRRHRSTRYSCENAAPENVRSARVPRAAKRTAVPAPAAAGRQPAVLHISETVSSSAANPEAVRRISVFPVPSPEIPKCADPVFPRLIRQTDRRKYSRPAGRPPTRGTPLPEGRRGSVSAEKHESQPAVPEPFPRQTRHIAGRLFSDAVSRPCKKGSNDKTAAGRAAVCRYNHAGTTGNGTVLRRPRPHV